MRSRRHHLPGVAFHITARTQGWQPWFVGKTAEIVQEIICDGVHTSDAIPLAHCVMPTHFHLVLRQGDRTLGWTMQPIMRRIALLIQRRHGVVGHVWERRFHSVPSENSDQLRRTIVYTHLNPLRKGICEELDQYPWSSHASYSLGPAGQVESANIVMSLRLFENEPGAPHAALLSSYAAYMRWRIEKDRCQNNGVPFGAIEPDTIAGDRYFLESFCRVATSARKPLADLRDRASQTLLSVDGSLNIDSLRKSYLPRRLSAVRKQVIASLYQNGYGTGRIADYFRVSAGAVSAVAVAMRSANNLKS